MSTNNKKTEYNINYAKEKLKRIPLDVQKEKYEEIKAAADVTGEKVNGYIKKAISAYPELLSSFTITFHLKQDITFNNDVFLALNDLLLKYSNYMLGFIREGSTKNEFKLILRLKSQNNNIEKITKDFGNILTAFEIPFSWSDITIGSDSEKNM